MRIDEFMTSLQSKLDTLQPNYLYHNKNDRNFVYFAMLTHACMAIYKIYQRCEMDMKELHLKLAALFQDPHFLQRVTPAKPVGAAYDEINGFVEYLLSRTQ